MEEMLKTVCMDYTHKVQFMYVDSINTNILIDVILYTWYGMPINHVVNNRILIRYLNYKDPN